MTQSVSERTLIARLVAGMPRSVHQVNRLYESDAELLSVPGSDVMLAITTDGVVEEIAAGLYDPWLAGWMTVTVNASDLAAVGAEPLGILVSESLPPDMPSEDLARLQAGIREAAHAHHLPVLGGDTNMSPQLQLTATAIGAVRYIKPLTRRGARPGDLLFATAALGLGTAFAFDRMLATNGGGGARVPFQPQARLREGCLLARRATACMDTSDGVIATLDELMQINDVGVRANRNCDDILHPVALATTRGAHLPSWTMLAGPHGEFELLFTIPSSQCAAFLAEAAAINWHPIEVGRVVSEQGYAFLHDDRWLTVDTARIRNLYSHVNGDPHRYLAAVLDSAAPHSTAPIP